MRRIATILFVLVLILIPASVSHGQSEGEAVILMEHQEDLAKSVPIQNGTVLKIQTLDGYKHKGILNGATDSSLSIGSMELPFSRMEKITVDKEGKGGKIGGLLGVIMGSICALMGLVFGLLGGVLINNNSGGVDGCAEAFLGAFILILGIALGGVGIIFFLIGIIAYAAGKAAGRSFRFDKGKWKVKKNN
jgi:hypothetical protein